MTSETVWNILRWVLIALAAGFVGQFGKSLALHLLELRRRRKAEAYTPADRPGPQRPDAEAAHLEARAKIEKKRAKAAVKQAKKPSPDREDERSRDDPPERRA